MKKVSIIVTYMDTYPLMKNFLEHLSLILTKYDYELVLFRDCICSSKVIELIKEYTENYEKIVSFSDKKNLGYSKSNNLAVEKSTGDILVFLNSDVFPDIDAIEFLVNRLLSDFSTGIVQGLLIYPDSNKVQSTGHFFTNYSNHHALKNRSISNPLVLKEGERQGLSSAFYAIRKTDFISAGKFDEVYYNSWDGLDLSITVRKKLEKKCIYFPHAKGYHIQGSTRTSIYRNAIYQRAYFWKKWGHAIIPDFQNTILDSLPSENTYYVINISTYPLVVWKPLLSRIKFYKNNTIEVIRHSDNERLVLEDKIPKSLFLGKSPILFLADNYKDFSLGYFSPDLENQHSIVDLHGNCVTL